MTVATDLFCNGMLGGFEIKNLLKNVIQSYIYVHK